MKEMTMKRFLAVLLAICMMAGALAGCGPTAPDQQNVDKLDGNTGDSGDSSGDEENTITYNIEGAFKAVDPDTVVMTVNGKDIVWEDFFYYVKYYVDYMASSGYEITDWSQPISSSSEYTYQNYVLSNAANWFIYAAVIEEFAKENNVSVTAEQEQTMSDEWETNVGIYGSEEAYLEILAAKYCTKYMNEYIQRTGYLADNCFKELYGENGSKLTDAELDDYFANEGYYMAKHILKLTTETDSDGNSVELSEDEKATKYKEMEDILAKLDAYTGDDFETYFDRLVESEGEDPGMQTYKDGYVFKEGDMVQEFTDAVKDLEPGAYSRIVESDYGYHIIYRLPLNYDVMPIAYSYMGYTDYTLRVIAAEAMYNSVLSQRKQEIQVSYAPAYESFDFTSMFSFG